VGSLQGLVTANGKPVSVSVTESKDSSYDLPYFGASYIAKTKVVTLPYGDNVLVLYPSMFEYNKLDDAGLYELMMKSADGTKVTWGPPSYLSEEGGMKETSATKFISVRKPGGNETKHFETDSRRLQRHWKYESLSGNSRMGNKNAGYADYSIECNAKIGHTDGTHTWQTAVAFLPQGSNLPVAIYLCGTTQSQILGNPSNPLAAAMLVAMADRGFIAANVEYDNAQYPDRCDSTAGQALGWHNKAQQVSDCIDLMCDEISAATCSNGVGVYGWSQGGVLSLLIHDFYGNVNAALSLMGL
jgi:hypothetical protein